MKVTVKVEGRAFDVEIGDLDARPIVAMVEGERFEVWPEDAPAAGGPPLAVEPVARPAAASPRRSRRTAGEAASPRGSAGKIVYAPIPGVIDSIGVQPGDAVAAGQDLVVLEAMKMKNVIRASRAGEIGKIHVTIGQHVRHNDALMEYVE